MSIHGNTRLLDSGSINGQADLKPIPDNRDTNHPSGYGRKQVQRVTGQYLRRKSFNEERTSDQQTKLSSQEEASRTFT